MKVLFAAMFIISVNSCVPEGSTRRVEKIIDQMTLEEKVDFIGGYKNFNIRPYEKYGIPEIRMSDGPVGVRNYGPTTAYPASVALAASWDRDLAGDVGEALGMEARRKNVHIVLGPAMNIHRAPYCGRNFEYLGEDPFLAGEIASAYIEGMQGQSVVAVPKHYAANYQDYDRHNISSDMDLRTLHEIYLPAFKVSVQKGKAGALMTSYNLINGVYASQHDYLISQVLKEDWGFEGVVMSDWTSTYNGVACARAGLDLEMPSGLFMAADTLIPAIQSGLLDEKLIDDKVRRILNLYERFGYFEKPDLADGFTPDGDFIRQTAINVSRGGVTLLKNERSLLPIKKDKKLKIAVIGINAHPAITGGGGSSYTTPLYPMSLLEAVRKVAGGDAEVVYAQALPVETELPHDFYSKSNFYTLSNGDRVRGLKAEFYSNTNLGGNPVYSSVFRVLNHTMSDSVYQGVPETNYSARFEGFINVNKTGYYRIAIAGDDGYRVYLDDKLVIDNWQNQPETVKSYRTNLVAGKDYLVKVEYYQGGGHASVRLGYDIETASNEKDLWKMAVEAALSSDYVIFSVGFNKNTETEGSDRMWELPYNQDEMIMKLAPLNANDIVVINAGGNISMPWLEEAGGIIHAWYPGQEGNLAVAEILFGITNPSGKLPVSFESRPEDNATYKSYHDDDGDKKVYFSEGVFMGYRHFDKSDVKPRFPFGFGLSYTTFEYGNLEVDRPEFGRNDSLKITFTVKNTGEYDGAETAQVYVSDPESALPRPVKELKGFEKVFLKKGEEKKLEVSLGRDAFSYYDEARGGWVTEAGDFEILIGSSSADIRLKTHVRYK